MRNCIHWRTDLLANSRLSLTSLNRFDFRRSNKRLSAKLIIQIPHLMQLSFSPMISLPSSIIYINSCFLHLADDCFNSGKVILVLLFYYLFCCLFIALVFFTTSSTWIFWNSIFYGLINDFSRWINHWSSVDWCWRVCGRWLTFIMSLTCCLRLSSENMALNFVIRASMKSFVHSQRCSRTRVLQLTCWIPFFRLKLQK